MPISSRRPPPANNVFSHSQQPEPYSHVFQQLSSNPYPAPPYDVAHSGAPSHMNSAQHYASTEVPYSAEHTNQQGKLSGTLHSAPTRSTYGPNPSRLPFFEAALARSRGDTSMGDAFVHRPQPLPAYLPPPDPNHPDLAVGFTQSATIQYTRQDRHSGARQISRSPSPGFDDHYATGYGYSDRRDMEGDVEKALLAEEEERNDYEHLDDAGWDERLSVLGLPPTSNQRDPTATPFKRNIGNLSFAPIPAGSIEKGVQGSRPVPESDIAQSTTQHFGPAPSGRVGRRTHNAAGHRRIKHTATLDENGFFAVDMPIPTRLAQFLPVKGVEEQKSTRWVALVDNSVKPDNP